MSESQNDDIYEPKHAGGFAPWRPVVYRAKHAPAEEAGSEKENAA